MSEEYNRPIRDRYRDMIDDIHEQIDGAGEAGLDPESINRLVCEANDAFTKGS